MCLSACICIDFSPILYYTDSLSFVFNSISTKITVFEFWVKFVILTVKSRTVILHHFLFQVFFSPFYAYTSYMQAVRRIWSSRFFMQCDTEMGHLDAGSLVTGTIDSKCDYGYLISVDLGSEKLKGVLYHIPEVPKMSQRSNTPSGQTRRRRRKRQLTLDPSRPKPNRSGYNFFFAEHYGRLKPSYHGQERAISKRIGDLWGRLSESEKQVRCTL